eukprot:TRINITY_DN17701_c0_g1_i1.p1 TRINITY_DN17701_c0_g1~~TRINITY_DN17701_c0_g1_i1.p1  ORF type:complete len:153 (+),score=12.28 TRINITY_DN17701_c0_g1_i1:27-485(+)
MNVKIEIAKSGLTDEGLRSIGDGLQQRDCPTKVLDVSFNQITDAGVFYIARGLAANRSLEVLKLNGTRLTDRGLDVVAKALQTNSTLRHLAIKGTQITAAGVASFSRSMALHNNTMEVLETSPHLPACKGLSSQPGGGQSGKGKSQGTSWVE